MQQILFASWRIKLCDVLNHIPVSSRSITTTRMIMSKEAQRSRGDLADQMKGKELIECGRTADRTRPLLVRLDGRAFHTFTRDLERPYDKRMSKLMVDTAIYLVQETQATLGYTQSDEISLFWKLDLEKYINAEYFFSGRYQKIVSVLASMASSFFVRELPSRIPEKATSLPAFDCRAWNVENNKEAMLYFHWRQQDAIENSIIMKAHWCFGHERLQGVSSKGKLELLREVGAPWEAEPQFFRSIGTISRFIENFCASLIAPGCVEHED